MHYDNNEILLGKSYTEEEKHLIQELAQQGYPDESIAEKLDRSTNAIRNFRHQANIIPKASFRVGGAVGVGHSRSYIVEDKYNAYVNPAKLYVGMIFDLLWDGAKLAREVIDEYQPQVSKEGYMDHWKGILEG